MEKSLFLMVYRPPRADFLTTMTEVEGRAIERHFGYLDALKKEEKLLFAGRLEDASMGIAMLKLRNLEEARRIFDEDPAVRAKVFSGDVKPFRLALTSLPGFF